MRYSLRNALLLLFALLCAIVGTRMYSPDDGHLTIRNEGSRHIQFVQVVVCNQPVMFSGMDPDEERVNAYSVQGASQYDVTVHFADGAVLHETLGHVAKGSDWHDVVTVRDAGMTIEQQAR